MALTVSQTITAAQNYPSPLPLTFGSSVALHQAIVACMWSTTATNVNPGAMSVADNLNGSYAQIGATYLDLTNAIQLANFFVVVSTAGAPTVTATLGNANNEMGMIAYAVTGFAGTPTIDAGAYNQYDSTTATTTISGNVASSFANEFLIATLYSYSAISVQPSGWTNGYNNLFYNSVLASAGANNFSATLGSAQTWSMVTGGIYDATGGGATLAWIT